MWGVRWEVARWTGRGEALSCSQSVSQDELSGSLRASSIPLVSMCTHFVTLSLEMVTLPRMFSHLWVALRRSPVFWMSLTWGDYAWESLLDLKAPHTFRVCGWATKEAPELCGCIASFSVSSASICWASTASQGRRWGVAAPRANRSNACSGEACGLHQCCLECGPWTAVSAYLGDLLEMQKFRPHPRSPESKAAF